MTDTKIDIYDEFEVSKLLMDLGVYPECKGYGYIITAMNLIKDDKSYLSSITKKLYPGIANIRNVKPSNVERCIRTEVNRVINNNNELKHDIFGNELQNLTNFRFIACLYEYFRINKRIAL